LRLSQLTTTSLLSLSFAVAACHDDHDHDHHHENEVITTVILTFTSPDGAAITASFRDVDGDGGNAPTIDPINLANGATYAMTIRFLNELESPAREITDEIRDEMEEHQVFLFGSAVNGPASEHPDAPLTHMYTDMDGNGLPVGLSNSIVAATGTGTLTLVLRHMPPINGNSVKTASSTGMVKTGGLAEIGGSSDVAVEFSVAVD
jgi:hypothetical protein